MAYLQELLTSQNQQIAQERINTAQYTGLVSGEAYAQYFPTWEVTAPQYPNPSAWSLSQLGYKTNEVAYACISLKMKSIAEPELKIYDKETGDVVDNPAFYDFMQEPCPGVSENDFHAANQMYLDIAGFIAWEKNMSNGGDLLNIWPMMPQYCSFMRGQGQLLRAIRYQPYTGLPPVDIDRSKVIMMMFVDPQYFGLKPLSPTAVLADVIGVDNKMTIMVQQFINNGAFVSGILKTDQVINEADARFAKERFKEVHSGYNNAGDIVVTGKGLEFQSSGNTFREMVFPEVDARSETRICMGYSVPPILVSAKSGMDRATYSNYEQARKAWYEEYVTSQWKFLAKCYTRDLLPHFDNNPKHELRFDTAGVKALQEDRTNQWKRAEEAYKARLIVRNTALIEMGLNPIGDSDPLLGNEYYQTVMSQSATTDNLDVKEGDEKPEDKPTDKEDDASVITKADEDEEEKHFRAFAKRRIKEKKSQDIGEFEFKYVNEKRQRQLLNEFGVRDADAEMVLEGLKMALVSGVTRSNDEMKVIVNNDMPKNEETIEAMKAIVARMEELSNSMKSIPAPVVTVENKVEPTPIEVKSTVEVSPTPIENKIVMPKLVRSSTVESVKRDGGNNIDGKMGETSYEYEGDE